MKRVWIELRRVGVVTLLTVGTAILQFLAGIIVARSLGPEGRGLVTVVISIAGIASIASALGTGVAFRRMLPQGHANVKGFARTTIFLTLLFGVPVVCLTILGVGLLVDDTVFSPLVSILFLLFGVTNVLWLQGKEALAAVGEIRYGATIGTIGSGLFLIACAAFAVVAGSSVSGMLAAYVLMNLLQAGLVWTRLRSRIRGTSTLGARALLRSGPPYLAYFLGQESVLRLDRTLVGVFSSSGSVGLFAVGAGLAEILRLPVLASGQFVLLDTANGRLKIWGVMKRVGLWGAMVAAVSALLWPLAPVLIPVIYGQEFSSAVDPFRILLVAQICLVPFLIVSRALVGMGGRWTTSIPSLVGLAVMFLSAPGLITELGALGGAITCALAYTGMSISSLLALYILSRAASRRN